MDNIYPLSSLYWQKAHSPNMSAFYAPYFANHSQAFAFLNKSRDETPACRTVAAAVATPEAPADLAVLAAVAAAGATNDSGSSLLSDPGLKASDWLWIGPPKNTHKPMNLSGPIGAAGGSTDGRWMVAQWNTPAPLPVRALPPGSSGAADACRAQPSPGPLAWHTHSAAASVCVYEPRAAGSPRPVLLVQEGGSAEAPLSCGLENDLFLAPTAADVYGNSPVGMEQSAPLSELSALRISFRASLKLSFPRARCGHTPYCNATIADIDYGYSTAGVTFSNRAARQTVFYQVQLWDTRCHTCKAKPCGCERTGQWTCKMPMLSQSVAPSTSLTLKASRAQTPTRTRSGCRTRPRPLARHASIRRARRRPSTWTCSRASSSRWRTRTSASLRT